MGAVCTKRAACSGTWKIRGLGNRGGGRGLGVGEIWSASGDHWLQLRNDGRGKQGRGCKASGQQEMKCTETCPRGQQPCRSYGCFLHRQWRMRRVPIMDTNWTCYGWSPCIMRLTPAWYFCDRHVLALALVGCSCNCAALLDLLFDPARLILSSGQGVPPAEAPILALWDKLGASLHRDRFQPTSCAFSPSVSPLVCSPKHQLLLKTYQLRVFSCARHMYNERELCPPRAVAKCGMTHKGTPPPLPLPTAASPPTTPYPPGQGEHRAPRGNWAGG